MSVNISFVQFLFHLNYYELLICWWNVRDQKWCLNKHSSNLCPGSLRYSALSSVPSTRGFLKAGFCISHLQTTAIFSWKCRVSAINSECRSEIWPHASKSLEAISLVICSADCVWSELMSSVLWRGWHTYRNASALLIASTVQDK